MSIRRLLVMAALLAGCAGAPPRAPVPAPAPPLSTADNAASWYRQAAAAGSKVLEIDPAQSLIVVTVRRGGALARLGHDHVVASRSVTGFVAPAEGRADFSFRLDRMTVDEPALRIEAGLDTQPSDAAIAGTRTNMLTRVLEAERFPLVALHAQGLAGTGAAQTIRLAITLHGVTRTVEAPTRVDSNAVGLTASGALQLRQTDFGIAPMSVMGGAMTVLDTMELRFRIVARAAR
jgi:polyisoprenoid-binding protein YceI